MRERARPQSNVRKRVSTQGLARLEDCPGGDASRNTISHTRAIIERLAEQAQGMTHWSCRLMAEEQQVSRSTVNRLWQLHNISAPYGTFKLSRMRDS